MKIIELLENGKINQKAFDLCELNGFQKISELQEFLKENNSFQSLKECCSQIDLELINLCKTETIQQQPKALCPGNFLEFFKNLLENKKQLLEDYYNSGLKNLTKRSSNSLNSHFKGKPHLELFIFTFLDNKNFEVNQIRNVGLKTEVELENFIQGIEDILQQWGNFEDIKGCENLDKGLKDNGPKYLDIFETFSENERIVLNNYFESRFAELPVRAKNALNNHFRKDLTPKNFIFNFLGNSDFTIGEIRNIGNRTILYLEGFMKDLKTFILHLNSPEGKTDSGKIGLELFLSKLTGDVSIPENITINPSIFNISDFIIKKDRIFSQHETYIFISSLAIYKEIDYKSFQIFHKSFQI